MLEISQVKKGEIFSKHKHKNYSSDYSEQQKVVKP
jgi:hypothetical protein